ncbi:MAG: uroporphyrinogen-III synthase [Pseudomonadota bacterium]
MSGPARTVLLTRPVEENRPLAEALAEDGIETLIWPLTRIVPLMAEITLPPAVEALLITSANGIRAFAALSPRRDLPVLAVGDRTAEVARGLGFKLTLSAGRDAEALTELAVRSDMGRFFHPRGRESTGDLKARLEAFGRHVSEAVVYAAEETGPPSAEVGHALRAGRIALATVWSQRAARVLLGHLTTLATPPRVLAISERAAQPLAAAALTGILVAPRPDSAAMRQAIVQALGTQP